MAAETLLEIRNMSKTFPGLRALDDVSLTVGRGEIVAIVGQNGSGKSTLVKILAGFHEADAGGELRWHEQDGTVLSGQEARRALRFIHQELGLIPMLSTIENLDLVRPLGASRFRPVNASAEARRAEAVLADLGANVDVRAPVASLTSAERAMVAIARALEGWTRSDNLLVLDEPTASLHGDEVSLLMDSVRRLAARGAGIIFISHSLPEVMLLADRIVVLRDGRLVEDRPRDQFEHDALVAAIAGEEIAREGQRAPAKLGDVMLSVRGLAGFRVHGVDFDVRAGEVVGITGILGSGREQLAGLLFGAVPRLGGEVRVGGAPIRESAPAVSMNAGMAMVPADRARQGVIMTMSARENLTLPNLRPLKGFGWNVKRRLERAEAHRWATTVDLRPPDPERMLTLLSGGNQQKVVMAKWLRNQPDVLLLDDPTQGVDVGAKATLHQLIAEAAAAGTAVLICSSDTEELTHLADRVIVLRDGRIANEIMRENLTETRLIQESHGREMAAVIADPLEDTPNA